MLTMKWQVDIPDETYYNKLVESGMAWEFYPDLPGSWTEAKIEILKYKENEDVTNGKSSGA